MRVYLYSSSFCGSCSAARTVLAEAARLVPAVTVVERNVALEPREAESAGIRATPTVVVEDEAGHPVFRAEGAPTLAQALAAIALAA